MGLFLTTFHLSPNIHAFSIFPNKTIVKLFTFRFAGEGANINCPRISITGTSSLPEVINGHYVFHVFEKACTSNIKVTAYDKPEAMRMASVTNYSNH